ncbi:hypothetical protein [Anaerosporobacter sp.]|uniref:hypothetical protein n=1 Tax=Anaerosporobacter sp. TaxID=1872529 RepID=UPI00286ED5EB|nr:hypothetical protein [Anaerosporobacter sp.]
MKSMKKLSCLLAVILVMAMAFTACGSSDKLAGKKFVLDSMKMAGMTISASDLELNGSIEHGALYLEFKKDGKAIISVDGEANEGTYTLSGKNLTLIGDGEEMKGIVDGNTITISEGEGDEAVSIVFKKD